MRPVRPFSARARAIGLLTAVVTVAALTTAGYSGQHRAARDGAPDQAAADVLHVARNQLGDPYVWGGDGPEGWDCSGLTSLWGSVGGVDRMPRVSRDQQRWAVPLPAEQALPGDLVFFGHPVTHVGLFTGAGRMLDASETLGGVVDRAIWRAGVVRYGRVPRPGMVKVTPWTPPKLPPLPTASPAPADDEPAAAPRTPSRRPTAAPRPVVAKPSKPAASTPTAAKPPLRKPAAAPSSGLANLTGLPGVQARPSSRTALAASRNATSVRGSTAWDDVSLVRTAWRHAGGGNLPTTRAAIVASGRKVALADARVGDLVVYNSPATHLGVYLGHGYMVDASRTRGAVVVRRVYASSFWGLVRLG